MSLPAFILIQATRCTVEALPSTTPKDWGIANVHAPDGFTFCGGEHSLVIHSLADLAELSTEVLITDEPCERDWGENRYELTA